jgi:hypothetical protein
MQKHKLITSKKFTQNEMRETVYRVQHKTERLGPLTSSANFSLGIYTNFDAPPFFRIPELRKKEKIEKLCWFKEEAFLERHLTIQEHLKRDLDFELVTATLIRKPFYSDNVQVVF